MLAHVETPAQGPNWKALWIALGSLSILFHLGLIFYGLVPNLVARPLHMALALPWVLAFAPATGISRITGPALCIIGIGACVWIAVNHNMLGDQYGFLESNFQIAVASILLIVVLEAARRAIGWPLPSVALIALLYGLFGQYIPGEFGHSGTPLKSFLGTLTIAEGGDLGKSHRCFGWRGCDLRHFWRCSQFR